MTVCRLVAATAPVFGGGGARGGGGFHFVRRKTKEFRISSAPSVPFGKLQTYACRRFPINKTMKSEALLHPHPLHLLLLLLLSPSRLLACLPQNGNCVLANTAECSRTRRSSSSGGTKAPNDDVPSRWKRLYRDSSLIEIDFGPTREPTLV